MKKKGKKVKSEFRRELEAYARDGVVLYLDGVPSTPGKIEKAHLIAEDVTYMRDYVTGKDGKLSRLDFDSVKYS
ncbi:MAG TPA: hypothetical protein IAA63_06305 [Candidatus Pullilachnospira stercoravium]|uniref:Uncharacterized protein n=1 Tax=Candidatus Pullilachnospira stercoravium TaxID=2840913 RepID=A0A9D1NTU8_9FIRM|nr:hypothetical protein [Candidatus Pullilachnospira stercoravium]